MSYDLNYSNKILLFNLYKGPRCTLTSGNLLLQKFAAQDDRNDRNVLHNMVNVFAEICLLILRRHLTRLPNKVIKAGKFINVGKSLKRRISIEIFLRDQFALFRHTVCCFLCLGKQLLISYRWLKTDICVQDFNWIKRYWLYIFHRPWEFIVFWLYWGEIARVCGTNTTNSERNITLHIQDWWW